MQTPTELPCVTPDATLRTAMLTIDIHRQGIVLVVDAERQLLKTITEGDVRRAILDGVDFDRPLEELFPRAPRLGSSTPITAPLGTSPHRLVGLMRKHSIRQVPLLDNEGRVAELVTQGDLIPDAELPLQAVIMAGGFGSRLHPLTKDTPKPMLEVGGKPLLEHTIRQLRQSGIQRVSITTHFQPEKIREHFGDGDAFGMELDYLQEDSPLGTAGALRLVEAKGPMLVLNGDILTRLDFRALLDFHREHRAALTVGVTQYDVKLQYGVVETDGPYVRGFSEKPVHEFFVNAGIYLLEPDVGRHFPPGRCDMSELITRLIAADERVVSFPIREYWLDIGNHDAYQQAQQDVAQGGRFHA